MRKYIILSLLTTLLICGCAHPMLTIKDSDNTQCVKVNMRRSNSYMYYQTVTGGDFKIELVGVSSYCSYNPVSNVNKAVIEPLFKITKMGKSLENNVDFQFYTETKKGPPAYIGKWQHSANFKLDKGAISQYFDGTPTEVRIPLENTADFEIDLGLILGKKQKDFNNKTFDVIEKN